MGYNRHVSMTLGRHRPGLPHRVLNLVAAPRVRHRLQHLLTSAERCERPYHYPRGVLYLITIIAQIHDSQTLPTTDRNGIRPSPVVTRMTVSRTGERTFKTFY